MNYLSRSANGGGRESAIAPESRSQSSRVRSKNAPANQRAFAGYPSSGVAETEPRGRKWETVEELYVASHPRFLRIAYAILRDMEDAEDAVQDAALSACLHLRTFEGRSAFTTWFTRIVINASLMTLRKRKSRLESFPEARTADDTPLAERTPVLQPDPEMAHAREETFQLLDAALAKIQPALREAFTLIHFDDLTMLEASALLGVSVAAVKARLFRARKSLRNHARSPLLLSLQSAPTRACSFRMPTATSADAYAEMAMA